MKLCPQCNRKSLNSANTCECGYSFDDGSDNARIIANRIIGQGLWALCLDFAESFCTDLRPKFQAEGFVLDPDKNRVFMREAVIVYFWLVWRAVLHEGQTARDVFNGLFNTWIMTQEPQVVETLQNRLREYDEAMDRDEKLMAEKLLYTNLVSSALRWLLLGETKTEVGFTLEALVTVRLWTTAPLVRKFMDRAKLAELEGKR